MADQVELRVNVVTSGQGELNNIAASMRGLEEQMKSGKLSLEQYEAAEIKMTALLEEHSSVVKKVTAAQKSLSEQHEILHAGTVKTTEAFKAFGESIHERITEPLGSAYFSVGKLAESFGPLGAQVAVGGLALAGMGALSIELVHGFTEAAHATEMFATRMGIGVGQARQLELASKLAGVEAHGLENASRLVAAALEDSEGQGRRASKAMDALGVSTFQATGEARDYGQVTLDVIETLSKLEDHTQRAFLATQILGRGAKEFMPLIENLKQANDVLQEFGLTYDEYVLKKAAESQQKFTALGIAWDLFKDKIAQKIEPIVIPVVVQLTKDLAGQGTNNLPLAFGDIAGALIGAGLQHTMPAGTFQNSLSLPASAPQVPAGSMQFAGQGDISHFTNVLAGTGDPEEKLKKRVESAKKDYDEELDKANRLRHQAALGDPVFLSALTAEAAVVKRLGDEYNRLNGQLKTLEATKEAAKRDAAFVVRMNEKDLNPVEKIFAERDDLLKAPGPHPGVAAAASIGAAGALGKMQVEDAKRTQSMNEESFRLQSQPTKDLYAELKEHDKLTLEALKQMYSVNPEISNIESQTERQGVIRQSARAGQIAQLSVAPGSGPQGQQQAINDAYNIRIDLANKLKDIDLQNADQQLTVEKQKIDIAKANADFTKETQDAQLDREMKLLELKKQQTEEARALSGSVFDAITSKDPAAGIKNVFLGQAKDVGRSVFSNITAPLFDSIHGTASGLKTIGAHKPDGSAGNPLYVKFAGAPGGGPGGGAGGASWGGNIFNTVGGLSTFGSDTNGITGAGGGFGDPANDGGAYGTGPSGILATALSRANTAIGGIGKIAGALGVGAASVADGSAVKILGGWNPNGKVDANGVQDNSVTGLQQAGAAIGLAGTAYAGVTSALHDFKKGGAQGITQGIGAIAGTAAAFDPEPISHAVLAGVAGLATVVGAIFGDPKAARQASIDHELTNSQYSSQGYIDQKGNFVPGAKPASISYFGASGGQSYDYNFKGAIRYGSTGDTSRNTFDPSANSNQPGGIQQPGGDPSGGSIHNDNFNRAPVAPVIIQVHAMDSKSFLDHASDISSAVRKGMQQGHPIVGEIQQAVRPT